MELEKSAFYLVNSVHPDGISKDQKRLIRLKANPFLFSNGLLLYVGPDKKYQESLRQVVYAKETQKPFI